MNPINKIDGCVNHPYYSLDNRFVGFNNISEKGMNEGTIVSQVGTTQTPSPESTKAPYIPEIGKGSLADVWS